MQSIFQWGSQHWQLVAVAIGAIAFIAWSRGWRPSSAGAGATLIEPPIPVNEPAPKCLGPADSEQTILQAEFALAKEAVRRRARSLERRKQDAIDKVNAEFIRESTADLQGPFGETAAPGG